MRKYIYVWAMAERKTYTKPIGPFLGSYDCFDVPLAPEPRN
jgi:hypothetical protein